MVKYAILDREAYIMRKKCLAIAAFLSVIFAPVITAANVSFLVIETGLSSEAGANQHSVLWEDGLLDVFFETGHIVSNAPVLRIEAKPDGDFPEEARGDLDEAIEGGADFFILALLDYTAGTSMPQNIFLQLYRIDPYKKIFEQQYTGKTFKSNKEEYDNLKAIVKGLVPHLNDQ